MEAAEKAGWGLTNKIEAFDFWKVERKKQITKDDIFFPF
jgi:hypothetical protein